MAYHKSRSKTHDYRSRCIYLITIVKARTTPVLSHVFGGLHSAVSIPGVRTTPAGDIVKSQLRNIPINFPEARLLQYVVMPDHLHFVIEIKRPTQYHLGELIDSNFIYLHVNYNPRDTSAEGKAADEALLKKLGHPDRFGFPALVVLDAKGNVLHIQDSSFLESGEGYDRDRVLRFLTNWTPAAVNSD